jgi:hypothetical protein
LGVRVSNLNNESDAPVVDEDQPTLAEFLLKKDTTTTTSTTTTTTLSTTTTTSSTSTSSTNNNNNNNNNYSQSLPRHLMSATMNVDDAQCPICSISLSGRTGMLLLLLLSIGKMFTQIYISIVLEASSHVDSCLKLPPKSSTTTTSSSSLSSPPSINSKKKRKTNAIVDKSQKTLFDLVKKQSR